MEDFSCSEKTANIVAAYIKFQKQGLVAKKDGTNPHYGSTFTTLHEALELVRSPLADEGLALIQMPLGGIEVCRLLNRLVHSSGEWMAWVTTTPVSKRDPQGMIAATTYLKRCNITSSCGLPETDDDGNTASSKERTTEPPQAAKPAPQGQSKPPYQADEQKPVVKKAFAPRPGKIVTEGQLTFLKNAIKWGKYYSEAEVAEYAKQQYGVSALNQIDEVQKDELIAAVKEQSLPRAKERKAPPLSTMMENAKSDYYDENNPPF